MLGRVRSCFSNLADPQLKLCMHRSKTAIDRKHSLRTSDLNPPDMAAFQVSKIPKVSVLIATHNRPLLLREAIHSVIDQTFTNWELVVVDDASTPRIDLSDLKRTLGDRLKVVGHKHARGSAAARNSAIRASTGDILAFLDDDDLFHPEFLQKATLSLARYPDVQVVFVGVDWFGPGKESVRPDGLASFEKVLAEAAGREVEPEIVLFDERLLGALLKRVPMAFQQQVVRRSALSQLGDFTEGRVLDRSDWAIRAALRLPCALYKERLYRFRCEGQSYASRPERLHESLLAGTDVMDTLLARTREDAARHGKIPILSNGAANSWFKLAYYYAQHDQPGKAMSALLVSQLRAFSLVRMRLFARVALSAVRRLGIKRSKASMN